MSQFTVSPRTATQPKLSQPTLARGSAGAAIGILIVTALITGICTLCDR